MQRATRCEWALIGLAIVTAWGCYVKPKGNLRTFQHFPPPIKKSTDHPILAFKGKTDFTWQWHGSLQGRAQTLIEDVGYFHWTNAKEAADYELVVNLRRHPHIMSGSEFLLAIVSGLTMTLAPVWSETDVYEMHAEILARDPDAASGKRMRRIAAYRPNGNFQVIIEFFLLFVPNPVYWSDEALVDRLLKDVVVWSAEAVEKDRASYAQ